MRVANFSWGTMHCVKASVEKVANNCIHWSEVGTLGVHRGSVLREGGHYDHWVKSKKVGKWEKEMEANTFQLTRRQTEANSCS